MKRIPLLCISIILTAGCSAKNYEVPQQGILNEQQIEERWTVDRSWWTSYQDKELDRVMELAFTRNIDLARSAIAVNKALFRARQLGAELVPAFSASADASSRSNLESGNDSRSFSTSLGLNYELDLWGRLRASASAQSWEYEATQQDLEATRLTLINSVINTYYNMAYLREALENSRKNLELYEHIHAVQQDKFQAGKTDGLAIMQSEQSLLSQKNSIVSLEKQLAQQERTLRDLLAISPEEGLVLALPTLQDVVIPKVELNVPLSALGYRPDVQAASSRLQKAFYSREATELSLFPTVSLGSSLAASASSIGNIFDAPSLSASLGLKLPFLDWNSMKWNIRISQQDFEDSKLNFMKTVTTALNEVDLYHSQLESARLTLENLEKKIIADRKIAAYHKTRYELGAEELKDWLDALRTLNNSELAILEARYQVISSTNAVYESLGGRFSPR